MDPVAVVSVALLTVGLTTVGYYYQRAFAEVEPSKLGQRAAEVPVAPSARVAAIDRNASPTSIANLLTDKPVQTVPHPEMVTIAGQRMKKGAVGEWEQFTSRSEHLRLNALLAARTRQGRAFAHFHPSIADPKQRHPRTHTHNTKDELVGALRRVVPQFYMRRTNVDAESGQRFYELVLPIDTRLGDIITDVAIRTLPNAMNLHRIHLNFSSIGGGADDIQYTLANLPKPDEKGDVHLDLGDSPMMLFKMLTRPQLVFVFTTEPQGMPAVILSVGTLKPGVRESLRRVANLAMPLDTKTNTYTLYSIWNPENVHFVDLPVAPEML